MAWSDDRLASELGSIGVVARATPTQKLRLVQAARAAGRTIAVTGDGVNDAPALNAADVAVAMGSGTAVAKGASDLVLSDDSFATLGFAIREGRRIIANVQKGLVFLVSTHVALLGFLLIATLAGFSLPLLPLQILWLELFIDLSTSVAFEREPEEPDAMRRRPRPRAIPLLTDTLLVKIAAAGGFSAFAALLIMLNGPADPERARWMAYTVLVVGQAVRAYANRSLTLPLWRLPMNGFLLLACMLPPIAVQVAIPYLPAWPPPSTPCRWTPWSGWSSLASPSCPRPWPSWCVRRAAASGWAEPDLGRPGSHPAARIHVRRTSQDAARESR